MIKVSPDFARYPLAPGDFDFWNRDDLGLHVSHISYYEQLASAAVFRTSAGCFCWAIVDVGFWVAAVKRLILS